jgi:dolichol-phosphate mannosyltransferase
MEILQDPILSIVVPVYNEEGNLPQLFAELINVLSSLNMTWELIFVDDGSADSTWTVIGSLHEQDPRVKGIRLSRNFGHQYALLAGLSNALGKAVISMDGDLQHPPSLISNLVAEWKKGNRIVNTIRIDSEDTSFFKKISARIFYKLFSMLSGVELEQGMADFRLLDRQVVNDILSFREKSLFLRGIIQWVGYECATVEYQSNNRYSGTSSYSLRKMIRFGLDGISSFSIIPLRIGVILGIVTSIISFGGIAYALYSKLITGSAVPGWASSVAILSFLLGITFLLLGTIGEYIGRILLEVKERPRFLIGDKVGIEQSKTERSP